MLVVFGVIMTAGVLSLTRLVIYSELKHDLKCVIVVRVCSRRGYSVVAVEF